MIHSLCDVVLCYVVVLAAGVSVCLLYGKNSSVPSSSSEPTRRADIVRPSCHVSSVLWVWTSWSM